MLKNQRFYFVANLDPFNTVSGIDHVASSWMQTVSFSEIAVDSCAQVVGFAYIDNPTTSVFELI